LVGQDCTDASVIKACTGISTRKEVVAKIIAILGASSNVDGVAGSGIVRNAVADNAVAVGVGVKVDTVAVAIFDAVVVDWMRCEE
jgi:hypothetical protein